MATQSGTKSSSCIPCSNRKVRCDRRVPCQHCKRRKGDVCEYPILIGKTGVSQTDHSLLKIKQNRIEELEQYITRAGGDIYQVHGVPAVDLAGRAASLFATSTTDHPTHTTGSEARYTSRADETASRRRRPEAGLVEHDEQTAYIEGPMWYSWSESRNEGHESHELPLVLDRSKHEQNISSTGYSPTLLDPPSNVDKRPLYRHHPSPTQVYALWASYLANVHPLVKIFFDWDKKPLMLKAAEDPASLAPGQQALVFAIYFIATLSLPKTECETMFNGTTQPSLLNDLQSSVEAALLAAKYAITSDLLVLQAFILYLLGMRNRAQPLALFSLMGIASRVAQRLGLHRDGSHLGLSPFQAEERRRTWWQLEHIEMMISTLVGCLPMTLYADWDAKPPANLEDDDLYPGIQFLPPDRHGLTTISHCLWRYHIHHMQRTLRDSDPGTAYMSSKHVSMAEKLALIERVRLTLVEKFLQHCEPVDPLHLFIQIGLQSFVLAMQRVARQPGIASIKIREMPQSDRDDILQICIKGMEYYVLVPNTPSIARFHWHDECWFQWTTFVPIVIEAHHRATTPEAPNLWKIIDKVWEHRPRPHTATQRPDVSAVAKLIIRAWQKRHEYLQKQGQAIEKPWCVGVLEESLKSMPSGPNANDQSPAVDIDRFASMDFDLIDWSIWDTEHFLEAGPLGYE